jgi:hypothetical protein
MNTPKKGRTRDCAKGVAWFSETTLGAAILLTTVGLLLLLLSWRTWPDVLVDFGRELYVAWQLSQGRILYQDIAYFNGPLSPYVNALWFAIFRTGFLTLALANLAVLIGIAALLLRIVRTMADLPSTIIAGVVFLAVFGFGQIAANGNYNYLAPYSHELTHGLLLSLLGIVCLVEYSSRLRSWWIAAAGLTLGLSVLTKPEISLALAAGLVAGLGAIIKTRVGSGGSARIVAVFIGSACVPLAVAWFGLASVMPVNVAGKNLLAPWTGSMNEKVTSLLFYRRVLGIENPGHSLALMFRALLGYVAAVGAPACLGMAMQKFRFDVTRVSVWTFAAAFMAATFFLVPYGLILVARPLPLLVGILLVANLAGWLGDEDPKVDARQRVARAAFLLFALVLLAKVILNATTFHYGFVLAMPAAIVTVVGLVKWLPDLLERTGGSGQVFRASAFGAILSVVVVHIAHLGVSVSDKDYTLGAGVDAIKTDSARGRVFHDVISELEATLPDDATIAVLPEGVMINYLARRANPTRYYNFMPPEIILFGEENIVEAFGRNPPDRIVLTHRLTDEYGLGRFGEGYGRAIYDWMRRNYHPIALLGDPPLKEGSEFGIEIFEKNQGDT